MPPRNRDGSPGIHDLHRPDDEVHFPPPCIANLAIYADDIELDAPESTINTISTAAAKYIIARAK